MTTHWAAREADKRAQRGRHGHGTACTCRKCLSLEAYLAVTAKHKQLADSLGAPAEPPGYTQVRRKLGLVRRA